MYVALNPSSVYNFISLLMCRAAGEVRSGNEEQCWMTVMHRGLVMVLMVLIMKLIAAQAVG